MKNKLRFTILIASIGLAAAPVALLAHHGSAIYDNDTKSLIVLTFHSNRNRHY